MRDGVSVGKWSILCYGDLQLVSSPTTGRSRLKRSDGSATKRAAVGRQLFEVRWPMDGLKEMDIRYDCLVVVVLV